MSIYQDLHDDVFAILKNKLPSYLTYHSPAHTAHVIEMAEYICRQENIDGRELYLVKIAAFFMTSASSVRPTTTKRSVVKCVLKN
ncbi:MAG: hypothetical protein IPP25_07450 [Saprospiraceae bacterium]|nr:hypothetical protein [Candidatus Opimibacter skivensis]